MDPAARDPRRPRPAADAGDGEPRRAISPRAARRRDDAPPRLGAGRHAHHARGRGRPAHRRGERRICCGASRWRIRPAPGAGSSHTPTPRPRGRRRTTTTCAPWLSRFGRCSSETRPRSCESRPTTGPCPPNDVDEIAGRCAGNALFLFELLDMVRATGTTESLPDSVESLIAGDIDRLSPTDRTVLRYASVLGATFDPELLAHCVRRRAASRRRRLARVCEGSSIPTAAGGCVSGTRSCATLPTRACRSGDDACCTSGSARRSRPRRVARGGGVDARAPLLRGAAPRQGVALLPHSPATGRRLSPRPSRRRASTSSRSRRRRLRTLRDLERAEVWISLGSVCEVAGMFEAAYDALRRATAPRGRSPPASRVRDAPERSLPQGAYDRALRETTAGATACSTGSTRPKPSGARATLRAMRAEVRALQGHPREAIALASWQSTTRALGRGDRGAGSARARLYGARQLYQMLGRPGEAAARADGARDLHAARTASARAASPS